MTRKRVGAGLLEAFSTPCECCNGRGVIITYELDSDGNASHHVHPRPIQDGQRAGGQQAETRQAGGRPHAPAQPDRQAADGQQADRQPAAPQAANGTPDGQQPEATTAVPAAASNGQAEPGRSAAGSGSGSNGRRRRRRSGGGAASASGSAPAAAAPPGSTEPQQAQDGAA
jgi:ribonuclease E